MTTLQQGMFGQEFWPASELASTLILTVQRVSQLQKQGVIPKPVNGRYPAKEAVSAYIRFIQDERKSKSRESELIRRVQLQNQAQEIKMRQESGELIKADEAERAWQVRGRKIRDLIDNVPDRLAGPLAAEADQNKVHALLRGELRIVLMELGVMKLGGEEDAQFKTGTPGAVATSA